MSARAAVTAGLLATALVAGLLAASPAATADPDAGLGLPGTPGVTYEATIRRTEGNVPHIRGRRLVDVSYGQGWVNGEDRPCDLLEGIQRISGERSRWFGRGDGDTNLRSDLAWRVIGIRSLAEQDWPKASSTVRSVLTAFAEGWNAQLRSVGGDHLAGWCAGAGWVRPVQPVEVYAYARSVALFASSTQVVDYVGAATPPTGAGAPVPADAAGAFADLPLADAGSIGSNGWAIGSQRSASGGGMLLANPHLPWEGEYRFSEVHLSVGDSTGIYGAQLTGLPGIAMGFTDTFGWAHTTASGNRFTIYRLSLVPGHPTQYRYGDQVREMIRQDIPVQVLGADGHVTTEIHTRWRSHYGPMLAIPELPWTATSAISIRDANIDDDEFMEQYTAMAQARSLDELIRINRTVGGQPVFNTMAASADGRTWFGDTAATPRLSPWALGEFARLLKTDLITAIAYDRRVVLLDGSDPRFEWTEALGSRDSGLVPFRDMPTTTSRDGVFNANDSFWLSRPTAPLEGAYSLLHGNQRGAISARTRQNALALSNRRVDRPAGADGRFTLDELAAVAIDGRSATADALKDAVVARCQARGAQPVEGVDLRPACAVLAAWSGEGRIADRGAPLWREFSDQGGIRWAVPYDPADPLGTPRGLTPAPATGTDPTLVSLARGVKALRTAGFGPDAALGQVQVAVRAGQVVPVPGGGDGVMNATGWDRMSTTLEPSVRNLRRRTLVSGSSLAEVTGDVRTVGYRVNNGSSFILAVDWRRGGPVAKAMLTYGNTSDPTNPDFVEGTRRFSEGRWRDVPFREEDVAAAATSSIVVRG